MDLGLKNAEGYYDLTAYEAIKNVTAEENRKKIMRILSGNARRNKDSFTKRKVARA